jgi:peroxiredoxin
MIDFGVPAALASSLGLLLPLSELAVAAALLPAATVWWGALGALALLLLFVVGIAINLARGRKLECHCFGQLHSAPAGWRTLTRNGVLAAMAAFVVWQSQNGAGPGVLGWIGGLSTAQLAALVLGLVALALLGGQWWFLLNLLRQNGRLLTRLEALEGRLEAGGATMPFDNSVPHAGLPVGDEAPAFSLSGLHGETITLNSLRSSGQPVMLLFTDPGCGPCTALLPEIRRWQREHSEQLTVSLVSRGGLEANRAKATEHGLRGVLLQKDWEVSEAYEVRGTPSAVLVAPDGKVASPVAGGAEGVRALLSYAVGERAQLPMQPQAQGQPCPNCGKVHPNGNGHGQPVAVPQGPKVGEPAPPIKLRDLEGESVGLEDFRGEDTLVLFWNPGCGFCQQMLPEIKQWEENRPDGTPKLLFVSAGTEEANRDMKLSSKVVLDQQFAAGRAFGASGTPSAVLVDGEGRIASEVAVGAPAVLGLAGASRAES